MNTTHKNNLGQIIREKRKSAGLSQEKLADILNVTKSTISKYELGQREPSFDQLQKIATAVNVDIYELLTGEAKDIYFQAEVDMVKMNVEHGYSFSDEESKLVTSFNLLNQDGQKTAIERVKELTEIQRYQARKEEISEALHDILTNSPDTREAFVSALASLPDAALPAIAEYIQEVAKDPESYIMQSESDRQEKIFKYAERIARAIKDAE